MTVCLFVLGKVFVRAYRLSTPLSNETLGSATLLLLFFEDVAEYKFQIVMGNGGCLHTIIKQPHARQLNNTCKKQNYAQLHVH